VKARNIIFIKSKLFSASLEELRKDRDGLA
jgi:uncharacterized membrane protein YqjE